jgi:tRNA A-37 threonylcarbamoyl transferase component Bud32/tetratricopeptide (TPR) repeat protein
MLEARLRAMPAPGSASATEIGNAEETESPVPGTTRAFQVSDYEILGELGKGGMGVVYRAYDRKRGEIVALKTMPWLDSSSLHRFKREFRALADLAHPNLVTLHELVSDGRNWFFTMELVEGADFLSYVRTVRGSSSRGDCSPALSATKLGRLRNGLCQLAEGIVALHEAGKLHRDIKPSNVLVTNQGRVVLLDFGLVAEMEQTGLHESTEAHVLGTFAFMSPEQAASWPVSSAADWYSVGVMLYQALTGRLPFHGSPLEILAAKQGAEPPPPRALVPGVPEDLDQLCAELLRKEPGQRPSGRQVLERLGSVSSGPMTQAPPQFRTSGTVSLVGRERHLDFLRDAFAATVRGKAVVIHVRGRSGQGKTSLVECFLDELIERDEVVVLAGRCYERESVPYKALDSLIDSLARYLRRLPAQEAQVLLPRDVLSLSRLFPVLQSVEAVSSLPQRSVEVPDPQEMRRRAFIALRDLLARLGDRRSLVLFIDDLHWGDVDSASLLSELLRPPDPPVFLLVGCYRSEDAATSPFLREFIGTQQGLGDRPDRRELDVEALTVTEAELLAIELLGPGNPAVRSHATAIARESGGNPIFVYELAQHTRTDRPADQATVAGDITFEAVLWMRIQRLSTESRRLLEVVAVSGRPLGRSEAFRAAELGAEGWMALGTLRSGRLVRMTSPSEGDQIETYHDRIRETVISQLPSSLLAAHHRRLALALEESGCVDAEVMARHFQGAGVPERAVEYYISAADRASAALAFDRAAELYSSAIGLWPKDGDEDFRLRTRLADALANAGRGAEAAREYLASAMVSPASDAVELQRRAALQLMISGHLDEGVATLRGAFRHMGMNLPESPRRALASLLCHKFLLRCRGLGFRIRDESEVRVEELIQIDLCWAGAVGLTAVIPILGADLQTRGLLLALRAGECYRIARAVAMEASHVSTAGGRGRGRVIELIGMAETLAQRVDNPHAKAMTIYARALAKHFLGEWKTACEWFERAEEMLRNHCTGVFWELNVVHWLWLNSLVRRGELNEVRRRWPVLLQEAQERGDLFAETNLVFCMAILRLANDEADGLDGELERIMLRWTRKGFTVQHASAFRARIHILLYRGESAKASKLIAATWPLFQQSKILRFQLLRIELRELRARCAIAIAGNSTSPETLLRSAEWDARGLDRERSPWASAYAQFIRGGIALRRGDAVKAEELLTKAAASFEAVDMKLNAAVTRRRLGELIGGDRGRALVEEADRWMMVQQIQNPARWAAMYAPGFST